MAARRDMYGWLRDLLLGDFPIAFAERVSLGDLPTLPEGDLVAAEGFANLLENLEELRGLSPLEVRDSINREYVRLFLDPINVVIYPYESWYVDGCLMGQSLLKVRRFMDRVGATKLEGSEPEDHIACELDLMRYLCDEFLSATQLDDIELNLSLQAEFLRDHLLNWGPRFCEDILADEHLFFYRSIIVILEEYLRGDEEMVGELLRFIFSYKDSSFIHNNSIDLEW